MPFSQSAQISTIVGYCESLQPTSVLDVGAGMGVYGFLLRTNLEHLNLFEVNGRDARQRRREEWKIRIDGIEGYATYLTPVHAYAYNRVIVGEALATLATLPDGAYELVMAIDILEHFNQEDGVRFLRECARVASRACLISTPKEFIHQEVEANPLEDHRSHWTWDDLAAQGYNQVLPDDFSWLAVRSKQA